MNAIAYEVRLALTAIQYFTRLPVPDWVGHSPTQLNRSARYFPFVGIVVGAITGLFFMLAHSMLTQPVAVIIAMIAGVLVTGGFHEDGLADTCDGMGGGMDKAAALTIMKDSHVGSYAVVGLTLALLLKFASLSAVPAERVPLVLLAAHSFSRFMAVTVMYTQQYVRDDAAAKAKQAAEGIASAPLAWSALWVIAPLWFLGVSGLVAAMTAVIMRVVAARYFYQRIGGYTGDCLGAVQQVTELAFYLGLLAWIST